PKPAKPILTLPLEGEDDTEDGPIIVAQKVSESVPPVKPREAPPDSELPTAPPSRLPLPPIPSPSPSASKSGGPPPPPTSLRKTVEPQDGNDPVRPGRPITLPDEPGLGLGQRGGPYLDLDLPEDSTEEAPLETTDKDIRRWDTDAD